MADKASLQAQPGREAIMSAACATPPSSRSGRQSWLDTATEQLSKKVDSAARLCRRSMFLWAVYLMLAEVRFRPCASLPQLNLMQSRL